ncbi:hypothetical protein [Peptostreptococcus russellii]|uniref:hypothetical protein n=1 Tax=Peptostreptococcus russellii TaxID=215200 RepID=UPI0029432117|nr:hypothetical protein [Peptostreptococcus russellii]
MLILFFFLGIFIKIIDLWQTLVYNQITADKRGRFIIVRTGRPTDNPKETRITVRLDSESNKILEEYSKKNKKTRAESIRDGIKKLKESK